MSLVLDTCALIWWSLDPEQLSLLVQKACEQMEKDKNGLVASISIWEIAIKIKNKKLDLGISLEIYIKRLQQFQLSQLMRIFG